MPDDILIECKKGLGLSTAPNEAIDGAISQKITTVKAFMKGAGVTDETMATNELATGVIVVGVNDIWDIKSGEVKFSSVFFTLLTQLAAG